MGKPHEKENSYLQGTEIIFSLIESFYHNLGSANEEDLVQLHRSSLVNLTLTDLRPDISSSLIPDSRWSIFRLV